ncbi:hypothetical protein C8Q80DRAFT_772126 [Daedaleopsis nitida]|nr:hypothetical protein C8Q80DRAFT_772126 [Daedaleopsis nitida]
MNDRDHYLTAYCTRSIGHSMRHRYSTQRLDVQSMMLKASKITSFVVCARVPVTIADILLVTITWRKLGGTLKNLSHPFVKHGFSDILLQDGTLYFVTIFILNSLHLIFSATSIFTDGGDIGVSELTRFTDPLTVILVYRFILDLQEANERNVKIGSDNPELQTSSRMSSQSSLSFVDRTLGSLGSTITPGARAAQDNDYDTEIWDEDHWQPAASESGGGVADDVITLDDLGSELEPHSEIQEVLHNEPLARAV